MDILKYSDEVSEEDLSNFKASKKIFTDGVRRVEKESSKFSLPKTSQNLNTYIASSEKEKEKIVKIIQNRLKEDSDKMSKYSQVILNIFLKNNSIVDKIKLKDFFQENNQAINEAIENGNENYIVSKTVIALNSLAQNEKQSIQNKYKKIKEKIFFLQNSIIVHSAEIKQNRGSKKILNMLKEEMKYGLNLVCKLIESNPNKNVYFNDIKEVYFTKDLIKKGIIQPSQEKKISLANSESRQHL